MLVKKNALLLLNLSLIAMIYFNSVFQSKSIARYLELVFLRKQIIWLQKKSFDFITYIIYITYIIDNNTVLYIFRMKIINMICNSPEEMPCSSHALVCTQHIIHIQRELL